MFGLFRKKDNGISAPAAGILKPIEESSDEAFAQKMLGDGFVIMPEEGRIVSPVDGKVKMTFPTMHAIGLEDQNGIEYLLHIGIDTVNLNGKGFKTYVAQGDTVTKGTLLTEFDLDYIRKNAKSDEIICVLTNGAKATLLKQGHVAAGEAGAVSVKL